MATYYVKNGGSDSNTGLSDAQAWETIGKVNGFSFSAGDDVYFKCGNTFSDGNLAIDWCGINTNNRSIIGAYYMDSGNETIGVNGGGKPILDGGWDLISYGGSQWQIVVNPKNADYFIVQDIKIINSHGHGLATSYLTPCTNAIIRRISIEDVGYNGIDTRHFGNGVLVEYCSVIHDNLQFGIGESTNWGGGIKICGDNSIGRYNEVGEGYGEGINVSPQVTAQYALVENNFVWGRQSVGIYAGCCALDATIRNNVVLGTTNTNYHKAGVYGGRTWNVCGISINQEIMGNYTLRNKIYNNVIAGCMGGIRALNRHDQLLDYADRSYFYNNTLIDNYDNINTNQHMKSEYKNNLSILHSDAVVGSAHVARGDYVGALSTDTFIALGNFWSSTPEFSQWEHASDVVGNPKLFKTSGWQNISTPSDIDIAASFALTCTSDAINTAQNLGDTYDDGFIVGTDFNTPDASDVDTPIVVVTGDQDDYGAGWDFGAFIYSDGNTPVPYNRNRGILRQKPQFNQIGGRFR